MLNKIKGTLNHNGQATGKSTAIDHFLALDCMNCSIYDKLTTSDRVCILNFIRDAYGIHCMAGGWAGNCVFDMYIDHKKFNAPVPRNRVTGRSFNYATLYKSRRGKLKVHFEVSLYE